MRLSILTILSIVSGLVVASPSSVEKPTKPLIPGQKCDPNAKGPGLQRRQQAAIKDFAKIFLVEKDAKKAFDAYIPGEYIQHNPDALSGRQPAIDFLTVLWGTPSMVFTNITAWAGEGIGMIHYRMRAPEADIHMAVMDRLRFEGTCFVEHWDVLQRITGNETNPLAFF
ncbi:hypothetical protein H1R20_g4262, partial [Candolleomyces eurysporus]